MAMPSPREGYKIHLAFEISGQAGFIKVADAMLDQGVV